MSAYAQINGSFDFNTTPLSPPGCRAVVYEAPEHRASWNTKGVDAWYIGPTMNHYRCHQVYVPATRAERIARTVEFFLHNCAVPQASPLDDATRAADLLASALKGQITDTPYNQPANAQLRAIQQLSDIFQKITRPNSKGVAPPRVITHPTRPNSEDVSPPRVNNHPPRPNSKDVTPPHYIHETRPNSEDVPLPRVTRNTTRPNSKDVSSPRVND